MDNFSEPNLQELRWITEISCSISGLDRPTANREPKCEWKQNSETLVWILQWGDLRAMMFISFQYATMGGQTAVDLWLLIRLEIKASEKINELNVPVNARNAWTAAERHGDRYRRPGGQTESAFEPIWVVRELWILYWETGYRSLKRRDTIHWNRSDYWG